MNARWKGLGGSWSLLWHSGLDLYREWAFAPEIAAIRVGLVRPVFDVPTWKVAKLGSSQVGNLESCEVLPLRRVCGFCFACPWRYVDEVGEPCVVWWGGGGDV